MKAVASKSNTVSGVAKVVVGESRVRVTFKTKGDDSNEYNGDQFKFDLDDVPEYVRENGEYYVSVKEDGTTFYGMHPLKGTFKTKFASISSRGDEPPAPRQEIGQYGPYLSFWVNLKITKGTYKGMEIPVKFTYKFVETDDELTAVEVGKKKGNAGEKLLAFLEVAGVGDAQIRYSDNVLPKLQKVLLLADKEFNTVMKDGWADYFFDEPELQEETDDDEDEPEPVKVSSRKAVVDDDDEEPKPRAKKVKKLDELDKFSEDIPF